MAAKILLLSSGGISSWLGGLCCPRKRCSSWLVELSKFGGVPAASPSHSLLMAYISLFCSARRDVFLCLSVSLSQHEKKSPFCSKSCPFLWPHSSFLLFLLVLAFLPRFQSPNLFKVFPSFVISFFCHFFPLLVFSFLPQFSFPPFPTFHSFALSIFLSIIPSVIYL